MATNVEVFRREPVPTPLRSITKIVMTGNSENNQIEITRVSAQMLFKARSERAVGAVEVDVHLDFEQVKKLIDYLYEFLEQKEDRY